MYVMFFTKSNQVNGVLCLMYRVREAVPYHGGA